MCYAQNPNTTVFCKYTRSLFRALSQMLAVGYGESPPQDTGETWVVIISMVLGCTLMAFFIALIVKMVSSIGTSTKKYNEIVRILRAGCFHLGSTSLKNKAEISSILDAKRHQGTNISDDILLTR